MRQRSVFMLAMAVLLSGAAGGALALNGGEAVQARRARFGEMTDALKFAAANWDEPSQYGAIARAAAVIERDARSLPTLFPAGTGPGTGLRTAALDAIWRDQTAFADLAHRLAEEAATLATIGSSTPTGNVRHQLEIMIATCKACHRDFRAN